MNTLGKRLLTARKLSGLTQAELTKKSGVSQQLISRIENDKVESTTEVFKLADALNVNPRWLATGDGEMESEKRTASDASKDEIKAIRLLRKLTSLQKENIIKKLENLNLENNLVINELADKKH